MLRWICIGARIIVSQYLPVKNQQHFALKALFGGDILEPVRGSIDLDDNCHVLDVGCGPGSWLLDLATSYPNSKFVGIDVVDMVSKKIKIYEKRIWAQK